MCGVCQPINKVFDEQRAYRGFGGYPANRLSEELRMQLEDDLAKRQ